MNTKQLSKTLAAIKIEIIVNSNCMYMLSLFISKPLIPKNYHYYYLLRSSSKHQKHSCQRIFSSTNTLYNHYNQKQQQLLSTHQHNNNHITFTTKMSKPSPPFCYFYPQSSTSTTTSTTSFSNKILDLTNLNEIISISENKRQESFEISSKLKVLIAKTKQSFEQQNQQQQQQQESTSSSSLLEELESLIIQTLPSEKQSNRTSNQLSIQFQEYARIKSFQYFLSTGQILPPSKLPPSLSDEEYLLGSIIGLTQDIARYVIGRATDRDVNSVLIARDVVEYCLNYLMTFDFRNGVLRRKYDGVKYALKTCETVLYELSVTGEDVDSRNENEKTTDVQEPVVKKMKMNNNNENNDNNNSDNKDGNGSKNMLEDELEQVRLRIEKRDELREKVIKRSRDAQKAAKQAIFAIHRNDEKRAVQLITKCENIVKNDLKPIVLKEPSLHYGSYSNVLEEYAEAKLFYTWLMEKPEKGKLLQPNDFDVIELEPGEYLGGLCDLTGEIGRYAVQRGTKRDSDGVHFCLHTNLSILYALETLLHFPSGSYIHKKMDQLRQSVEKLERMLYELSLVHATGRQIVVDSVKDQLKERGNVDEENDK